MSENLFTPEFVNTSLGEFVIVANHNLETEYAVEMSIKYNLARISMGISHLPAELVVCRLIFDIRGQNIADETITHLRKAFSDKCSLEFIS